IIIRVRTEGVIPATGRLYRRTSSAGWQVNEMLPDARADGVFSFVVPQAGGSFDYYIRAGDARTRTFRIAVVRPPQIERLALVYTYPAYTGLAPKRIDSSDGEVSAIAGTTVTVEVMPTKPLRSAELMTKGDKRREALALELEK